MSVGLKQPRGDGQRCVTLARAAAKETTNIAELVPSGFFCPQAWFLRRSEHFLFYLTAGILSREKKLNTVINSYLAALPV